MKCNLLLLQGKICLVFMFAYKLNRAPSIGLWDGSGTFQKGRREALRVWTYCHMRWICLCFSCHWIHAVSHAGVNNIGIPVHLGDNQLAGDEVPLIAIIDGAQSGESRWQQIPILQGNVWAVKIFNLAGDGWISVWGIKVLIGCRVDGEGRVCTWARNKGSGCECGTYNWEWMCPTDATCNWL